MAVPLEKGSKMRPPALSIFVDFFKGTEQGHVFQVLSGAAPAGRCSFTCSTAHGAVGSHARRRLSRTGITLCPSSAWPGGQHLSGPRCLLFLPHSPGGTKMGPEGRQGAPATAELPWLDPRPGSPRPGQRPWWCGGCHGNHGGRHYRHPQWGSQLGQGGCLNKPKQTKPLKL